MKLVRDYIPEIIEEDGRSCYWRQVSDHAEHLQRLKLKIIEEADEFIENPSCEEAADMLEVVKTFINISGLKFDDVVIAAKDKAIVRGSFKDGIVLERVYERTESG
tara:strand:+ start:1652 stop:1969 length:318 start_codon:yes stop_codon:yes gene_type:complete